MGTNSDSRKMINKLKISYKEDTKKIWLELSKQPTGPVSFCEESEIDFNNIDASVREVNRYLSEINRLKNPGMHLFDSLKKACQPLYFDLLGKNIKKALQKTIYKDLMLEIDENLLYIPWELFFDGKRFLCERFNIGRTIKISAKKIAEYNDIENEERHLRMLIIADPTEELKWAYEEGDSIDREFKNNDIIKPDFQSHDNVDINFVKKNLPNYDIVHYTGHVKYDTEYPEKSGWIINGGVFSVKDIENMGNSAACMPILIFCNACQSGYIDKKWVNESCSEFNHVNEQLVHAFMMAGVRHYIGTLSVIPDEYASHIGIDFYHHLLAGDYIGEALRKSRESFKDKYANKSLSWINYVLYGNPCTSLIESKNTHTAVQSEQEADVIEKVSVTGKRDKTDTNTVSDQPIDTRGQHPSSKGLKFQLSIKDKLFIILCISLFVLATAVLIPRFMSKPSPNISSEKNSRQKKSDIWWEKKKWEIVDQISQRMQQRFPLKALPEKGTLSHPSSDGKHKLCIVPSDPFKKDIDTDLLIEGLITFFVSAPEYIVAERERLDFVLREFELTSFSLDEDKIRFLIGEIFGTRWILFVKTIDQPPRFFLSNGKKEAFLRLVETRTTNIDVKVEAYIKTQEIKDTSRALGEQIIASLNNQISNHKDEN